MRVKLLLLVCFVFLFVSVSKVSAHPLIKEVLGDSTTAAELDVPQTTAGPGLLLPDSPFYFLDNFVQNVRLFFAFSSDQKAKIHENVANERLAELRVMLARNNANGIATALAGLSNENAAAATALSDAAAQGKDVKQLAEDLNNSMKQQQIFLGLVSQQATGSLQLRLHAANEDVTVAKLKVEDKLPEDLLVNEVQDTLRTEIASDAVSASNSAQDLEHAIDILTKLASDAAMKQQTNREQALEKVIANKNDILQHQTEITQEARVRAMDQIRQMRVNATKQAVESIQQAQEAVQKFEDADQAEKALTNSAKTAMSSSQTLENLKTVSPKDKGKDTQIFGKTSVSGH